MIDSVMSSAEYLSHVSQGINLSDPRERKILSFSYDPSDYSVTSIDIKDKIFWIWGFLRMNL